MKYLKLTIAILIVLGILGTVIHFYRESIIREFANSALSKQGITVADLSIQTLDTELTRLSHLILEDADGTRYQASGLSIPLSFPSTNIEKISIEKLIITPADAVARPLPLADLLHNFLQLPSDLPNTMVAVSQLMLEGAPPIRNMVWQSAGQEQHISFSTDGIAAAVSVSQINANDHQLAVTITAADTPEALTMMLTTHQSNTGYSISGQTAISLAPWVTALKPAGILPPGLTIIDGKLAGPASITLQNDATQSSVASIHFALPEGVTAEHRPANGPDAQVQVNTSTPITVSFTYPSFEWEVHAGSIDLLAKINTETNILMLINDLNCRSGMHCTIHALLEADSIELKDIAINNVLWSGLLELKASDKVFIKILPNTTLTMTGIEAPDFSAALLAVTQFSGAQIVLNDNEWNGSANNFELTLNSLSDRDNLTASLPLTVKALHFHNSGSLIKAEFSTAPETAAVKWDTTNLITPGFRGTISLDNDNMTAALLIADNGESLSAHIDVSHNMRTGKGTLSIHDASLHFEQKALSDHLSSWPYAWDILSGTWTTQLDLTWATQAANTEYTGSLSNQAFHLEGHYNDIVFTGFSADLNTNLNPAAGTSQPPSSLEIALLDVGVPIEQISANLTLNSQTQVAQIDSLSMSVLGGKLATDPFSFALLEENNTIVLRPQSIQLPFIVDLVEFADIELSGSISGVLPITISNQTLVISNGLLKADPPGGVIRYLPGVAPADTTGTSSGINLVTRALGNFQFDSLTSDVSYAETGDLELSMRLNGINPDMDDRQPVILNLTVENNIPQLLRSLQATRSIEEILERKSAD